MADEYDRVLFEDTIDVVVLRTAGEHTVPVAGSTPIDLNSDTEPVDELLTELLAATVHLRADEGVPSGVLEALRDRPVPATFRASAWLDASRAIVVRDGVGGVGGLTVRYSDGGGLRFDGSDAASDRDPDPDSDPDDDYADDGRQ